MMASSTPQLLAKNLEDQLSWAEETNRLILNERAACAELVRAAGCLCFKILVAAEATGTGFFGGLVETNEGRPVVPRIVVTHDPRCPQALAAAIEERK